jgi:peptidoglycan glycosyltransferase
MDRSIRRLGVFLVLLFCALFVQLNYIQVYRANSLNTRQGNTREVYQAFNKPRGSISTADGQVIARSVKSNDRFDYQREYPGGALYGQITGYFNFVFGDTGLERTYNNELSGTTARQRIRSVGDFFTKKDRTGNITLTVRRDVQQTAHDSLGNQRGSVVALDPSTGAVLALWSNPSYDPNPLSSHDNTTALNAKTALEADPTKPLLAASYRDVHPPGSTFKVVTGATGVQTGAVTPTSPSYPQLTALNIAQTSRNLRNFAGERCGGTLFDILATSCNTSFAQMGLDLGGPAMIGGAKAFGFGEKPPIDLPAPAISTFPEIDFKLNQPALAQAAIGQGNTQASPLQMALVAAGIANDGVVLAPHVVNEIRDGQGDLVRRIDPTQWKRAISPQTADVMRQAMRQVVQRGTATGVQIPGIDIGAKTGTAQAASSRSYAWLIAWAGPQGKKPTIAVAVMVEGSDLTEETGGRVAAPIARQVIQQALMPVPGPPAVTPGAGG